MCSSKHMFSDDEIILLVSTQHMPECPLTEKAELEEQEDVAADSSACSSWSHWRSGCRESPKQLRKGDSEQGNNWCEIKDPLHVFTTGGNAKI